ncbi:MAG: hypothetical protein WCG95_05265 [bacterium]
MWQVVLNSKTAHYVNELSPKNLYNITQARISEEQAGKLVTKYPDRYLTYEDARQLLINKGDNKDIFNLLEQRAENATEIKTNMHTKIKALAEAIRNAYNDNKSTKGLFNDLSKIISD